MKRVGIEDLSPEDRQRAYDRLDPGRDLAQKVWRLEKLTPFEAFIGQTLGYLVVSK